ncbi:MAG TPA: nucleotidyltransferase domain-containing protein [Verrucomicrobiae bacterium]|nr:nucleotidyltransferase domain-containing protein [Verrucomicrobiae bacterium]
MTIDPRLHGIVAAQPYPLLFATISGAHLYGFSSPDSDFDLRGAHVLPLEHIVGLEVRDETTCGSFFGMLFKKNGYVLEQLFSPLIVHTTPKHEELKEICCPHPQPLSHPMGEGSAVSNTSPLTPLPGRGGDENRTGVITKPHAHHYFGFAETQWKLFLKESPRRVKPLLYVYRVLLTGIHLMRTGQVEANLVTLNEEFRLPYIADLVARKLAGSEQSRLEDADIAFHETEYQRLRAELQSAHEASVLPEMPSEETRAALNDLLVRIRLRAVA